MRPTGPFLSRRPILLSATVLFATMALVPGALAAEHVDLTFGEASKAYPEGDPGQVPIDITYTCSDFLSGGDFTIKAEADAGSAVLDDESFSAAAFGTDCTGDDTFSTGVNVSADATVMAGDPITLTVTVTPPSGDPVEKSTQVTVGPFVDVAFQANATSFELAPGDTTSETITVVSDSNDQVMVMTDVTEYPEGWNEPSLGTPTIDAAADGSSTAEVTFDVAVPSDAAEGDYSFVVSLFAHSTSEASIATEPVQLAYTVVVAPSSGGEGGEGEDTEEGPGPAAPALIVGLAAALVGARRRRA